MNELVAPMQGTVVLVESDAIRPDLAEVHRRRAAGLDANRPEAVQSGTCPTSRVTWPNGLLWTKSHCGTPCRRTEFGPPGSCSCAIVLRKAYGLGAMAMFGGGAKVPLATVAWPTAEFGAMGIEGAVKLGFRRELDAITDPVRRKETLDEMVRIAYERGKALNTASMFEVDDVIDPVDTRGWITATLAGARPAGGRRPNIDTW